MHSRMITHYIAGGLKELKQAASLRGMPQPKLSNMLRGNFAAFQKLKMLECLTLLGSDVQIVVKSASRARKTDHVSGAFA